MALLSRLADPRSVLIHPDRNPITREVLKKCIYDHFCAGTNASEVRRTISSVKAAGFAGIILCPSREIVAGVPANFEAGTIQSTEQQKTEIEAWKQLHLETLGMVGKGDYMGIKFTGAGSAIFDRLAYGKEPPIELTHAVQAICEKAASQGSRIWIDAEQQIIQPTIHKWAVDVMRTHNTNGNTLVSNTYQAYLKSCSSTMEEHLRLAQSEGWALGVKLVRGAYIASDIRDRVHDTKADTDAAYDSIAAQLITRKFPGFGGKLCPDINVFLAGHNATSINKAVKVYQDAVKSGQRYSPTRWGQLQGMADEVSCELLQQCEIAKEAAKYGHGVSTAAPDVFKCLQWGTVGECMQFLLRRATENNGGAQRMAGSLVAMRKELKRRVVATFRIV